MNAAGIKIFTTQAGNGELTKVHTLASTILTRFPDLAAMLCAHDSKAVVAVRAPGREEVKVADLGFDLTAPSRLHLQNAQKLFSIIIPDAL